VSFNLLDVLFVNLSRRNRFNRVPTGQEKLEKVREFVWSGKGLGKILFFKKSGKMILDHADCRYL